jgi:hypothetical protein
MCGDFANYEEYLYIVGFPITRSTVSGVSGERAVLGTGLQAGEHVCEEIFAF